MKTFIKNHLYHFILLFFLLLTSIASAGYLWVNQKTTPPIKHLLEVSKTLNYSSSSRTTSQADRPTAVADSQKQPASQSTSTAQETKSFVTATDEKPSETVQPAVTITSTIYVNDQKYELVLPKNSSVHQAMNLLSQQTNFTFGGKQYASLGFFVDEINGLKNNSKTNQYWIYYINDQSAKVGISNYNIKSGDIIKWRYTYETSQF